MADKRSANKALAPLEAIKMKEELLKYVDEIVARQNKESPTATFESFMIENSARKVLRELLAEYQVS